MLRNLTLSSIFYGSWFSLSSGVHSSRVPLLMALLIVIYYKIIVWEGVLQYNEFKLPLGEGGNGPDSMRPYEKCVQRITDPH